MKGSSSNSNPYLSGCKATDPVPDILARNSLLMKSLLLPSNKSQNTINQLQLIMITRSIHYKNVHLCSCLKEAYPGFCSMSDQSVFLLSSLDGMLDLRKVTPPTPNTKFSGTHAFIHLGGERHCESN